MPNLFSHLVEHLWSLIWQQLSVININCRHRWYSDCLTSVSIVFPVRRLLRKRHPRVYLLQDYFFVVFKRGIACRGSWTSIPDKQQGSWLQTSLSITLRDWKECPVFCKSWFFFPSFPDLDDFAQFMVRTNMCCKFYIVFQINQFYWRNIMKEVKHMHIILKRDAIIYPGQTEKTNEKLIKEVKKKS